MNIERNYYLQRLINHQQNGLIKVITGIRRCGKSYLLFNLFKTYLIKNGISFDHIIEIAFDDFANKALRDPNVLYSHVKEKINDNGQYYLLLDEVQLLSEFEDVLNGFLHIGNVDIYVTGSNAKLLSKDIITEFRGRGDQIHISPLSFSEFMTVFNGSKEDGWAEYLQFGGLPPVFLQKTDEDKISLLKNLLAETYITDILNRNNIKNELVIENLFKILASNIGGLTNPQKLANTFKSNLNITVAAQTIKKYIDYFSDSFLVEAAIRYDVKGKKYIGTPSKYYFSDLGLRNANLNFRQSEKTHLMENAIYNELRTRGYNVDVGSVIINSKDNNGTSIRSQLEVDFVCNKGSERCYIQSALSLPTQEKINQELKSLLHIDDSFRKIVVVGDHIKQYQDINGITFISIYDFMLNIDCLK